MSQSKEKLKMHVFRRLAKTPEDDVRIDDNMSKILSLLDGHRSMASIAFASGMSMAEFQKAVKALIDLDLIVPVDAVATLSG